MIRAVIFDLDDTIFDHQHARRTALGSLKDFFPLLANRSILELEKIRGKDRDRIVERIKGLSVDPRPSGSKKLSGQEKFRISQGDYRILYEVRDEIVTACVVRIANRRDAYRNSQPNRGDIARRRVLP